MVGSGIDGCLGLKDSAKGEIGTFSGRLMNRPSETSSSFETNCRPCQTYPVSPSRGILKSHGSDSPPGVITFGVPFAAVR